MQPPARERGWRKTVGQLRGGVAGPQRFFDPHPHAWDRQVVPQGLEHMQTLPRCRDRSAQNMVHFVDAQHAEAALLAEAQDLDLLLGHTRAWRVRRAQRLEHRVIEAVLVGFRRRLDRQDRDKRGRTRRMVVRRRPLHETLGQHRFPGMRVPHDAPVRQTMGLGVGAPVVQLGQQRLGTGIANPAWAAYVGATGGRWEGQRRTSRRVQVCPVTHGVPRSPHRAGSRPHS